jgi:cytochrome P450
MTVRPVGPTAIFDPATYADGVPYELFAQLRQQDPVCWIEEPPVLGWPAGAGFWAVFGYDDVRRVLLDDQTFSSWLGATQIRDPDTAEDLAFVRSMMLNMDRPDHTRLRRLLIGAFTPRAITHLENQIRRNAAALIEAAAGAPEVDFVSVISDLPVLTLADVLGMPHQDRFLMYDWANRIIGYQDPDYAGRSTVQPEALTDMGRRALEFLPDLRPRPDGRPRNPRSPGMLVDMFEYARLLLEHKRADPGDDVMSILLRSTDEGGVSREEFQNLFFLFVVAGNETLRNGIPGGMLSLLQHPDQVQRLRAAPDLLGTGIEEMLRFSPPVIHFRRTARVDVEIGGQRIAAGEKVVVYFASANRDPRAFADPDVFDVARSPNKHLSFGFGPHLCLGAHLARVQMRAVFAEVLGRFDSFEAAGNPVRLISNFQNGLKSLPIRWSARVPDGGSVVS